MKLNWKIGAALGLIAGLALVVMWRHAHAQVTINSPIVTVAAITGTSSQIIGSNPTRKSIQICNGSASIEYILPVPAVPTTTSAITLPAVAAGVQSCFSPPLNGGAYQLGAGSAWNAISAGSTNIIILEWF
jgi:hypothetical protein